MVKKLLGICLFLLITIGFSSFSYAEANVPLNVELQKKITSNTLPYHEFHNSVIINDTLYVPERQGNKITAINANDGSIKWEYQTNGNTAYYQFSSAGDILFFQANGTLTALKDNGSQATVLWTKPYNASRMIIDGTTLYLFQNGQLVSLEAETGKEKWFYTLPSRERPHSNIVASEDKIFFVTDNQMDMERKMYALNKSTSQVLWTTNSVDYYAQKLRYQDGIIYTKSYRDLQAFHSSNGLQKWKKTIKENFDFELNETTIFTRTPDRLVAAHDFNGNQLWQQNVGSRSNGLLFATSTHVIVNGDNLIKWYDVYNGELVRTISEPGVNLQPYAANNQALLAIDTNKNVYYYIPQTDTEPPSMVLDTVTSRFAPHERGLASIHFILRKDAYTTVVIKNEEGQAVRTIDFGFLNRSWNLKYWDGKDDNGEFVSYGVYTLTFHLTDLSGNTAVFEDKSKSIKITDIRGTIVEDTLLRKGPGTNHEPLMTVPRNTQVTILDEVGDWFSVNLNTNNYKGYVPKAFVATHSNPDPKPYGSMPIYTVVSGDTLWLISQKHQVSIQSIIDTNQLDTSKHLFVGQRLAIPTVPIDNDTPKPEPTTMYTVVSGDTLWIIAQKHRVTVQELVETNNLDPNKHLFVGQRLAIPTVPIDNDTPKPEPTTMYTVVSGDTLWIIAQKHGVTVQELVETNNLDPNKHIFVGQRLVIPVPPVEEPGNVYTVVSGDTLWLIAQRNQVTVQSIVDANNLDLSKHLYVGQKLIIK